MSDDTANLLRTQSPWLSAGEDFVILASVACVVFTQCQRVTEKSDISGPLYLIRFLIYSLALSIQNYIFLNKTAKIKKNKHEHYVLAYGGIANMEQMEQCSPGTPMPTYVIRAYPRRFLGGKGEVGFQGATRSHILRL